MSRNWKVWRDEVKDSGELGGDTRELGEEKEKEKKCSHPIMERKEVGGNVCSAGP